MPAQTSIAACLSVAAVLLACNSTAQSDEAKYPNLKGQWDRVDPRAGFDPGNIQNDIDQPEQMPPRVVDLLGELLHPLRRRVLRRADPVELF